MAVTKDESPSRIDSLVKQLETGFKLQDFPWLGAVLFLAGFALVSAGALSPGKLEEDWNQAAIAMIWVGAVMLGFALLVTLGEVLSRPEDRKVAALKSLAGLNDPRAYFYIRNQLRTASPELRIAAVHALAKLNDSRAVEVLAKAATDTVRKASDNQRKEEQFKCAVAQALGKFDHEGAVSALAALSRDSLTSVEVRREGIAALGRLRRADSVAALFQLLESVTLDTPETVERALASLGVPRHFIETALGGKRDEVVTKLEDAGRLEEAAWLASKWSGTARAGRLFETTATCVHGSPTTENREQAGKHFLRAAALYLSAGYWEETQRCMRQVVDCLSLPWVELVESAPAELPPTKLITDTYCVVRVPLRNSGRATAENVVLKFRARDAEPSVLDLGVLRQGDQKDAEVTVLLRTPGIVPFRLSIEFDDAQARRLGLGYSGFLREVARTTQEAERLAQISIRVDKVTNSITNVYAAPDEGVQVVRTTAVGEGVVPSDQPTSSKDIGQTKNPKSP